MISEIPEVGLGRRVALSVRNAEQATIGYIWVSETARRLTVYEQQWLKQAAKKTAGLLDKTTAKQLNASNDERLWRILTNTYRDSDVPKGALDEDVDCCICLIDVSTQLDERPAFQEVMQEITPVSMFEGQSIVGFIFGQNVIDLVSLLSNKLPSSALIACGNVQRSIDGAVKSFEQATKMIQLKKKYYVDLQKAVFYYEAVG
ncbi:hypothetical protein [Bacillus sp. JCM 19041]|uniref:hypothetical protein n=1 Tax=Bacillus sp. JCM 19041 TaxID=1460637 RepID=UPI0006D0BA91